MALAATISPAEGNIGDNQMQALAPGLNGLANEGGTPLPPRRHPREAGGFQIEGHGNGGNGQTLRHPLRHDIT